MVNGLVADDGTGDALMEQGGIKKNVPVAFLCGSFLAVYVDDISQQLEGVERNADGQGNSADKLRHGAENAADQSGILEVSDQADISDRGHTDPQLFTEICKGIFDTQSAEPGYEGHKHQKQDILRLAPGIENHGEYEKYSILLMLGTPEATGKKTRTGKSDLKKP